MTDWLNPLNRIRIQHAVKAEAETVTLDSGKVFVLDYDHRPGYVRIRPKGGGFVPMGDFDLKTIKDKVWLAAN